LTGWYGEESDDSESCMASKYIFSKGYRNGENKMGTVAENYVYLW